MNGMNTFQKAAARSFKDGKYAALVNAPAWPSLIPGLGDTLFAFVMLELSFSEGCIGEREAAYRMIAAARELLLIVEQLKVVGRH